LLALLVHLISPKASTSLFGSLVFNLADYFIIAAAFVCVALDLFEGLKNKSR
jgi:lipoprotein signal peptidase